MIILDTNVVSELIKPRPDPKVVAWIATADMTNAGVTTLTVMELKFGIARLPAGRRRDQLGGFIDRFFSQEIGSVLAFNLDAAEAAAEYLATRAQKGRPLHDFRDAQIAGVVIALAARGGSPARSCAAASDRDRGVGTTQY